MGARAYRVLTGPSPAALAPLGATLTATHVDLPECDWGETVFWRVDSIGPVGDAEGDLWRFQVDRGQPRCPDPPHGSVDTSPDALLRWQCPRQEARYDVWAGPTADDLTRLATGLKSTECRIPLPPGTTLTWRVDARIGTHAVSSRLWQTTVGTSILIEDFEDYHVARPLAGSWNDGRALHPMDAPVTRLASGPNGAMQIHLDGAARTISRPLDDHPDWGVAEVSRLRLRLRGTPGNAPIEMHLYLTDATGQTASLPISPPTGWVQSEQWVTVDLPLPTSATRDRPAMVRLALWATSPGRATFQVDDMRLIPDALDTEAAAPPIREGRLADIRGAPPAPDVDVAETLQLRADVCVVGGGSGGIGAALAASRAGASVLLVERENILGGTSTAGGVASWEPGPGDSFARELFGRLTRYRKGIMSDKASYDETLTRAGNGHIQFDPPVFHDAAMTMLRETGLCRILLGTTFIETDVQPDAARVVEVRAIHGKGTLYRIRARVFIDCTGSGFLCQAAGCEVMLGAEPADRFGESGAPQKGAQRLNAIELIYRIRPSPHPTRQGLPQGMAPRRGGAVWPQPSGEAFVNTCGGLAPGWMLMELGYEGTRKELEKRALAHWHELQTSRYPTYEFDSFAPMLAIREAHRIVGNYVLTQNDLLAGIARQDHDDIIALADHPMDTHGSGGGLGRVAAPYGIPFRCLVPKGGWTNLLIACRGASFSHIAASSCRLSRTMMALGHAAGLAAAQCSVRHVDITHVDVNAIQETLGVPGT